MSSASPIDKTMFFP